MGDDKPFEQSAYVWQRKWTPQVRAAVERAVPFFGDLLVYAGDFAVHDDSLRFESTGVDWDALSSLPSVTLVFRAEHRMSRLIAASGPEGAVTAFVEVFDQFRADARRHATAVGGFQIDFDCPTEFLGEYAKFVECLRQREPEANLSITALPTWLTSKDFPRVIAPTSFYVLQVHGLDKPARIGDSVVLCDSECARTLAEKASRFHHDFYVALPTYTYAAVFTPAGEFKALIAETGSTDSIPKAQVRYLAANPAELAPLVGSWRRGAPRNMRGIIWFRLPVETDRMCWSWPALQMVMNGVAPESRIVPEMRVVREDLRELWISSTGAYHPFANIRVRIEARNARIRAFDGVNGFTVAKDGAGTIVSGPAPRTEEPVMAGWWVIAPEDPMRPAEFNAGPVEVDR